MIEAHTHLKIHPWSSVLGFSLTVYKSTNKSSVQNTHQTIRTEIQWPMVEGDAL
jgi:hypothetical protein